MGVIFIMSSETILQYLKNKEREVTPKELSIKLNLSLVSIHKSILRLERWEEIRVKRNIFGRNIRIYKK